MYFQDLRKKDLSQKVKRLYNFRERWSIWGDLSWLQHEGNSSKIKKRAGVDFLGYVSSEVDCIRFALGDVSAEVLVPGVISHCGIPKEGDIIIYGSGLRNPAHVGIYLKDDYVLSKWGAKGPLMRHKIEKIIPDYGNRYFFSDYKGKDVSNFAKLLEQYV